jgi:hypothetical protein
MQKYWYVMGSGRPNYRHEHETLARAEAERLAKIHSGQTFEVLEFVASCKMSGVQWSEPASKPEPFRTTEPKQRFRLADGGDIGKAVYLTDDPDALPPCGNRGVLQACVPGTEYPFRSLLAWKFAYVDTYSDDPPF